VLTRNVILCPKAGYRARRMIREEKRRQHASRRKNGNLIPNSRRRAACCTRGARAPPGGSCGFGRPATAWQTLKWYAKKGAAKIGIKWD
jgi:hypothetical protein